MYPVIRLGLTHAEEAVATLLRLTALRNAYQDGSPVLLALGTGGGRTG